MNRDVLHATVVDTAAFVGALGATFSAYIRERESEVYHCEVMMNFYKNHIELLRDLSLSLHDVPYSQKVEDLLIQKSLDSQQEFDRLLDQRNAAEGVSPK